MMEAKAKVMYSHANQFEQLLSFYSILMIVMVIMVILVIRGGDHIDCVGDGDHGDV